MRNNIYRDILNGRNAADKVVMLTFLSTEIRKEVYLQSNAIFVDEPDIVSEACIKGRPVVKTDGDMVTVAEPFVKTERLIILGGGHISLALSDFAGKVGFQVVIVDDRPEFANPLRFPNAEEIICDDFEAAIPKLKVSDGDYVAIVTRGHQCDRECLQRLAEGENAGYIGLIGSRRRVTGLKKLLQENGVSKQWLDTVYTPIGLDIGAVTPEEIAVSIIAEMIQVKRMKQHEKTGGANSDIDMSVIEKLAKETDRKKAVVTVIGVKGSAPRKSGAKMIVYEDGNIFGTIGGGYLENSMVQIALDVIRTGGYRIEQMDLSNEIAASEGMVCGGAVTILIEEG